MIFQTAVYNFFWRDLEELRKAAILRDLLRNFTPNARRHAFNIGWAFGRIGQLLEEKGTQNDKGEWRVIHDEPLGPAITLNRPRIKW